MALLTALAKSFVVMRAFPFSPSESPFRIALRSFTFVWCVFLGAARFQLSQPRVTPADVAFYNDRKYDLLVTGWVAEMPDRRDTYANLRIRIEAVDSGSGDYPVRGLVLARIGENEVYHYGDRLMSNIPVLRGVYKALKQMLETVVSSPADSSERTSNGASAAVMLPESTWAWMQAPKPPGARFSRWHCSAT